jgi:hypothetical protein
MELKISGATKDQLKSKVMMFFGELPADKQEELKTKWKGSIADCLNNAPYSNC